MRGDHDRTLVFTPVQANTSEPVQVLTERAIPFDSRDGSGILLCHTLRQSTRPIPVRRSFGSPGIRLLSPPQTPRSTASYGRSLQAGTDPHSTLTARLSAALTDYSATDCGPSVFEAHKTTLIAACPVSQNPVALRAADAAIPNTTTPTAMRSICSSPGTAKSLVFLIRALSARLAKPVRPVWSRAARDSDAGFVWGRQDQAWVVKVGHDGDDAWPG